MNTPHQLVIFDNDGVTVLNKDVDDRTVIQLASARIYFCELLHVKFHRVAGTAANWRPEVLGGRNGLTEAAGGAGSVYRNAAAIVGTDIKVEDLNRFFMTDTLGRFYILWAWDAGADNDGTFELAVRVYR